MFENDVGDLFEFDKENLTFEDCLISIFTGNYTENILSSDKKNDEEKPE